MKKAIMKNILGLCVAATMFAGNAEAGQVNTIIDTGSGMFAEPEKIYQEIDDTIKGWFFPSEEEMREMTFTQRRALKEANLMLLYRFIERKKVSLPALTKWLLVCKVEI